MSAAGQSLGREHFGLVLGSGPGLLALPPLRLPRQD
jgi:hypothetical protein